MTPNEAPAAAYFRTARLNARPFTSGDAEAFAAYRADPAVARYQSWSDYTLEEASDLITSMQHLVPGTPGFWYQLALESRANGCLVGDLAIKVNDSEPSEAEIGFTLAPTNHGMGYGTEAVRGLLEYAFDMLRLRRVIAVTDALNSAAAALLERVGMRREAHFHDNVFFKGAWGSEFTFALLSREWPTPEMRAIRTESGASNEHDIAH
jgi:RimJ/RimL family protein N-acetyltransferase